MATIGIKIIELVKRSISLGARAQLVSKFVPKAYWLSSVDVLCRLQCQMTRLLGRHDTALENANLPDKWMRELTRFGTFPTACRMVGAELLERDADDETGLLMCGLHVPWYTLVLPVMVERLDLSMVVAAAQPDGKYFVTGTDKRIDVAAPGPSALLGARRQLAKGNVVVSMLDAHIGTPLQPHFLQIAQRVNARVLLFWAEMEADGKLTITFSELPHPSLKADDAVQMNLSAIDEQREGILRRALPGVFEPSRVSPNGALPAVQLVA